MTGDWESRTFRITLSLSYSEIWNLYEPLNPIHLFPLCLKWALTVIPVFPKTLSILTKIKREKWIWLRNGLRPLWSKGTSNTRPRDDVKIYNFQEIARKQWLTSLSLKSNGPESVTLRLIMKISSTGTFSKVPQKETGRMCLEMVML